MERLKSSWLKIALCASHLSDLCAEALDHNMPLALEQPKRPVGGAYGIFMNERRSEFMDACKGQAVSAVSKMGGEAWKKLTATQKAPFQKKYVEAKAKFDKDMAAYLAAGGEIAKGARAQRTEKRKAKAKQKKDPNAPKKPFGGAYGVFLAENREKITKSLPEGSNKTTDVTKAAGEQWKKLSEKAKMPYQDKYDKKMKAYFVAFEEYKKNLPEDAEEDEDENEEEEADEDEEESEPSPKKARKAGA